MKLGRLSPIVLGLVAFGLYAEGKPQEATDAAATAELLDLLNTPITSASKQEQRSIEAPSVISVVTRDQISRYGWNSLNDILYKQPGFGPAQDYDRHTVSSRGVFEGWNNNHILHLVDGLPFNDNLYGTAYTSEITPLFMVKNVEILRGPGSALYGSNAMNGLVQMNTVSASDLKDGGETSVRLGNAGQKIYDAVMGHTGSRFSGVVGYSTYETSGNAYPSYDGSGRTDAGGALLKLDNRDARSSHYFWAKLEGQDDFKGLTLQYHDQDWRFETGLGWLWWVPDFSEFMRENRKLFSVAYHAQGPTVAQDYALRLQRHQIMWNMRTYPAGAFGGYYPEGMWEYLDTQAKDYFGRAQFTFSMPSKSSLLVGFEGDSFRYGGDREHFTNVNIDDPSFPPVPTFRPGAWLDYLKDHPLNTTALYGQYTSGDLVPMAKVTVGGRYDRIQFDYTKVYDAGRPEASRTFSQFSPRLAVVLLPSKDFSVKLMAGKAFRAPSPTELAGAHTFSLASNPDLLKPEIVTTVEVAFDWIVNSHLNWRTNFFSNKLENLIAYSAAANNLSTNVYTLKTMGAETELLFGFGRAQGFLNYSYAKRGHEEVLDTTVAPSQDRLTWEPSSRVNFGVSWTRDQLGLSLQGHWQGAMERRANEVGTETLPLGVGVSLDLDQYRSRTLDSWFTLDGKASWAFSKDFSLFVEGTNLLDTNKNKLVKNGPFPFDYQQDGRRVRMGVSLKF